MKGDLPVATMAASTWDQENKHNWTRNNWKEHNWTRKQTWGGGGVRIMKAAIQDTQYGMCASQLHALYITAWLFHLTVKRGDGENWIRMIYIENVMSHGCVPLVFP